jgi:aspartyl-tRNA(Asn)/glutamyl-tRNA(Gln) amidotransferase subunit C
LLLAYKNTTDKILWTPNSRLTTPDYLCRMEVNDKLVEKVAHLARLKFDESEKESIKKDLQRMIEFADKLNELNLDGVEPLLHMSEEANVLREDEIKGSISREEALKNAPEHDDHFFKVPKVINPQPLKGSKRNSL